MEKGLIAWIGVIILLLIITIVLAVMPKGILTGNAVAVSEKPVVKIGVVVPLTGESSFIGTGFERSIKIAMDNLKDTKYDYQVIYEDIKNFDSKETSSAIQKLIFVDNVDAILSVSSGTGNIVSPIAEQNKVIHIGYASDPTVARGSYNFVHATTPQAENSVLIKELENRGIKRLALFLMNQEGAIAIDEDFKEQIKDTDLKIVSEQKFNLGTKDFRTILLKAKETNPDIYLFHTFSPELEILAKQAKELEITSITCVEAFDFTTQPELFEGLWYVSQAVGTDDFRDAYEDRYHKEPPIASPNAYDMLNLIVRSYESSGENLGPNEKPSKESISEKLESIRDYNGAVGELNVLPNHIIDSKASLRMIMDGRPVTIMSGSEEDMNVLN